jgi:hypothetical protein
MLLLYIGLAVAVACEDATRGTSEPCCDTDAAPAFLASRLDDDDGDGNPRDEDFPDINDEDDDIADHAWIQDDAGVFHLFFHNEGLFGPSAIEHYTSTDLRALHYAGVALAPVPGTWEQSGLWAPHVIRVGDTYWMFYTGVTGVGADHI